MKITQLRTYFCALFIALATFVTAQTGVYLPELRSIDSSVARFMERWNLTGGAVAISKHGRLVYNRGFGYADRDYSTNVQPDNQFRIASISKPLTAVAIMKLVEQGALSLDTTVFGEQGLLNDAYYTERIKDRRITRITVRHLLEHTSGWDRKVPYGSHQHSDAPFFPLDVTKMFGEPNPVGDSTLIRFNLSNGLQFTPGKRYAYSNVGYLVLGKVIEKVTGIAYERYVKENVLEPVGAFDTHIGKTLHKLPREVDYIDRSLSVSCFGDGEIVPKQYGGFNLEAMNAHGGWVSTASDLTRVLLALDATAPKSLLSENALRTMTTSSSPNSHYAKGWSVNDKGNWWHTGSLDGTSSFAARTDDGYTWVLLFNGRADNSAAFWTALDRLPKDAIASVNVFPRVDLFETESVLSYAMSRYFEEPAPVAQQTVVTETPYESTSDLSNKQKFSVAALLRSRSIKTKRA